MFESWIIQKDCTMGPMKRALPVLICLAAFSAACTTEDPTTVQTSIPTTPVSPKVENFTGSVKVKDKDVNPFTVVLSNGTLTVTLTSVTPSIPMVIAVGSWDAPTVTCTPLPNGSVTASASPTTPQLAGQVNSGSYCLIIADTGSGTQTATVSYTATITHY
jgi:hypothetical protein